MMQEARWTAEVAIMNQRFPMFAAFKTENGSVGFFGSVRGRRTGREYTILVKVPAQRYPEMETAVYIDPRIAPGYWNPNGSLSTCHVRPWRPQINTIASCVLVAIQFLEDFDR
jgi:hypothetical protein